MTSKQPQLVQNGVIHRLGQVTPRHRQLLLGIEHVNRGTHPDLRNNFV